MLIAQQISAVKQYKIKINKILTSKLIVVSFKVP